MRQPADPSSGPGTGLGGLDGLMTAVMRDTGASIGLLYLFPPGDGVLWLTLVSGVSPRVAAPYARAPLDISSPVVDAVQRRSPVWLGSQGEMSSRYPQLGVVVPYDFMLAALPVASRSRVWGGIALLWPIGHPPRLRPRDNEAISAFCRKAAGLLERSHDQGRPLLPPREPLLLPTALGHPDPVRATAALRFTERLPVGCCELDLDGKVTFINPAGADLVGVGPLALVGNYPWEVLHWLNGPVFEDRYRFAVITRQSTSFTAVRPPDTPLLFELYPGGSGISVHITAVDEQEVGSAARQEHVTSREAPAEGEAVGAMGLYHLTHMSAVLAEAVGVQDVVDLAADQIVPGFGAQGLVILIVEEGRLRAIGQRGYSTEFIDRIDGAPLTFRSPATRALATDAPAFFPTFEDFLRDYPDAPRYQNRSAWAFLPLTASGRAIGSLTLSYDRPRAFPPAERAILTSLAGLMAQALDRANLYDAKHALAHALQNSLLPRVLPRFPGLDVAARYLPAGHGADIGGDFYDLVRGRTTLTAAIGDVQGHNPSAAALMGQVRTAVHAHANTDTPPGELLARTNVLLTDLDAGLFTSCLIVRVDLTHHRLHLASAGHPPALLRHPGGATEVLRVPPGLLLGIDPGGEYPTAEIPFPPGAVLALYTDGLVEIPGTDIDDNTDALALRVGQDRSPDLDQLADALIRHAEHSAPRLDDIALLLLRREAGT
ncbi:SpoIIE family protein phosphatase [Streptomyces sp. NBC_01716]|uniref:SpoIIE family protein phosphatase n=1 Tax=Streptomyces sp. NBC_01716 TaxID=2975917 RepID=UPI002E3273A5|nr:SpoIIE family protein phosphatase [Streptomyces sp. NBC_01716]